MTEVKTDLTICERCCKNNITHLKEGDQVRVDGNLLCVFVECPYKLEKIMNGENIDRCNKGVLSFVTDINLLEGKISTVEDPDEMYYRTYMKQKKLKKS